MVSSEMFLFALSFFFLLSLLAVLELRFQSCVHSSGCTCFFIRNTMFYFFFLLLLVFSSLIIELKRAFKPFRLWFSFFSPSLYVCKSLEDKCVSQPFILSLKLLKSSGPRSASYVCAFIYMIFVASIYVRVRLCVHLRF